VNEKPSTASASGSRPQMTMSGRLIQCGRSAATMNSSPSSVACTQYPIHIARIICW